MTTDPLPYWIRKLASRLRAVTGPVREQRVREAFDMYDVSGDGFLDMEEMRNAMSKMFLFNQEEVNRICHDLDTSNDGVISYKEFSGWMRRGTHSKEVLKGKTILAPIDSDGLDAVFYVFCGPGKTEMEMKDFVKFCKNCQITDSTLPTAAAELVFNDHRVKGPGRRTLDFFEFGAALEQLAERKHMKVSDLYTLALLTGGPQAKLVPCKMQQSKGSSRRRSVLSQRKRRAKKLQPILQDKDAWKRDVDNCRLWKIFGLDTSAGRQLRQIYGSGPSAAHSQPAFPKPQICVSIPPVACHPERIQGEVNANRLSPQHAGMNTSISLPLIASRPPAADHAKAPASHL
ncbi:unnamed protein product [Cladocopium goreaui]|uniref:Calmodulin n=1 Tax=Cladocopium goreaui TaxID=2562237 RepID=A0A9P1DAB6_9DINO|nr:unnamed protein product [Cladocopium goreaui]